MIQMSARYWKKWNKTIINWISDLQKMVIANLILKSSKILMTVFKDILKSELKI